MMTRIGVGLCVAGLLAVAPQPAAAQMVDDFMCSTFSYKCHPNPTLPPPQLAPGTEPVAAPAKHASKVHKRAKRTAAKAETAAPAPASADAAAPK